MFLFSSLTSFLTFLIALLMAITVHEFSHAAMADHLGDPTPRLTGRLTLNPFAHLDPIGTIMLFIFRFGWGKPVQIDPFNLQNPRRDQALISLAGPGSNLILAVFLSFLMRLMRPMGLMGLMGLMNPIILLNLALGIFNLLPIFPLDGFKIASGLLSPEQAEQWDELRPFGPLILFLLIFPFFGQSIIGQLLFPIINWLLHFLLPYGYTGI